MQELHYDGRTHEGDAEQQAQVLVDIITPFCWQVRTLTQSLHEDEVREGCEGDATEDGDAVA